MYDIFFSFSFFMLLFLCFVEFKQYVILGEKELFYCVNRVLRWKFLFMYKTSFTRWICTVWIV